MSIVSFIIFAFFSIGVLSEKANILASESSVHNVQSIQNSKLTDAEIRENAKKYLNLLEGQQDTMVDPFDMMDYSGNKKKTEINKSPRSDGVDEINVKGNDISSDIVTGIKSVSPLFASKTAKSLSLMDKAAKSSCDIYLYRWINMIMLRMSEDPNAEVIGLTFYFHSSTNIKKMFAASDVEFTDMDNVFSELIGTSSVIKKESTTNWLWLMAELYYFHIGVFIVISLCMYCLYRCFRVYPFTTLIFCFLFVDYMWHYMHLYMQKQAHKQAELASFSMPSSCRKHDFTLFESIREYIKSYFSDSNCNEYFEAIVVDSFYEVSPGVALSEAVTSTIFQPLSAASKLLNIAVKQLFNGLNTTLTIIVVFFLFLAFLSWFKLKISLPFFMGSLEPVVSSTNSSNVKELTNSQMPVSSNNTLPGSEASQTLSSLKDLPLNCEDKNGKENISCRCVNKKEPIRNTGSVGEYMIIKPPEFRNKHSLHRETQPEILQLVNVEDVAKINIKPHLLKQYKDLSYEKELMFNSETNHIKSDYFVSNAQFLNKNVDSKVEDFKYSPNNYGFFKDVSSVIESVPELDVSSVDVDAIGFNLQSTTNESQFLSKNIQSVSNIEDVKTSMVKLPSYNTKDINNPIESMCTVNTKTSYSDIIESDINSMDNCNSKLLKEDLSLIPYSRFNNIDYVESLVDKSFNDVKNIIKGFGKLVIDDQAAELTLKPKKL